MSKGLFNWPSYTERKGDKITTPEKGKDTIPNLTKHKEQRVRVIRIYVKHRRGYIVGRLEEGNSIKEKAIDIMRNPDESLIIVNGMYVDSDRAEILRQEEMSDFYIRNSSIDFLEMGKGWLIENTQKEGDN